AAAEGAARSGDNLSEMSSERAAQALRQRSGPGGRPAPLPGGTTRTGPAGRCGGAAGPVGAAASSGGPGLGPAVPGAGSRRTGDGRRLAVAAGRTGQGTGGAGAGKGQEGRD